MSTKAVILVGGAADGSIGKTIGQHLYEADYQLYVLDRFQEAVNEPIGDGEPDNDPLAPLYYSVDLRDYSTIRTALGAVVRHIQVADYRLHGVVYAAGVNHLGSVHDLTTTQFDDMIGVNLRGVWLVARELSERALDEGIKRTVPVKTLVLGSNTAYVAKTRSFGYAASKAGLAHMLRCMHREMAPNGWEFTSLDFGIVMDSAMTEKTIRELGEQRGWSDSQARDMLLKNVPTGMPVTRDEIAAVVKFLLSQEARSFGGSSVRFDGGQQQG